MTDAADNAVATGDAALARCIACTPAEFATNYWGRAPLLSTAAELRSDFSDLLDADAVDQLIAAHGLRTPFLRMAKNGKDLSNAAFTRGAGVGATAPDQAADDKVLSAMADGTTLVLHALHRTWPPLVAFGNQLSRDLGHPVQINSYITPPENQGFAPHYDTHDVFVLQIAGRKRWTIHEPVVTAPLENDPHTKHSASIKARVQEAPVIDAVLEPGDVLYLPRGTIHAAKALGETSIHLTVGVRPLTRSHIARILLDLAQEDADLRASLPMGVDLTDPAVLAGDLHETVALMRSRFAEAEVAPVARSITSELRTRTRPKPVGPLAQLQAATQLTPDTVVHLRPGLYPQLDDSGDELRLSVVDRTISLPADAFGAVKVILSGEAVTAAQLPGLSSEAQTALVQTLLRQGVIVPA